MKSINIIGLIFALIIVLLIILAILGRVYFDNNLIMGLSIGGIAFFTFIYAVLWMMNSAKQTEDEMTLFNKKNK